MRRNVQAGLPPLGANGSINSKYYQYNAYRPSKLKQSVNKPAFIAGQRLNHISSQDKLSGYSGNYPSEVKYGSPYQQAEDRYYDPPQPLHAKGGRIGQGVLKKRSDMLPEIDETSPSRYLHM